jgi:hypothetical protein
MAKAAAAAALVTSRARGVWLVAPSMRCRSLWQVQGVALSMGPPSPPSTPTPPSPPSPGLLGRAVALWQSWFGGPKTAEYYDRQIAQAHAALQGVRKSENLLGNVHSALQKPLGELSRLDLPELRKLAHHAYYGIGVWATTPPPPIRSMGTRAVCRQRCCVFADRCGCRGAVDAWLQWECWAARGGP